MKKLINTKGTEFEQNMQDLAIIDTEDRAGKPVMLSSEIFNESFENADQDVQEMIEVEPSGPTNIYRVTSEQEMNALQNVEEGAFCLICNEQTGQVTEQSNSDVIKVVLKPEVTLDRQFDSESYVQQWGFHPKEPLNNLIDMFYFNWAPDSPLPLDDSKTGWVVSEYILGGFSQEQAEEYGWVSEINWESEDGLHFQMVRYNEVEEKYEIVTEPITMSFNLLPMSWISDMDEWETNSTLMAMFADWTWLDFKGLYQYINNEWVLTNLYMLPNGSEQPAE